MDFAGMLGGKTLDELKENLENLIDGTDRLITVMLKVEKTIKANTAMLRAREKTMKELLARLNEKE